MLSITEENYLKALFKLTCEVNGRPDVGTNDIAAQLQVKPATATDMLKKLKEKKLVDYEKYGKSSLTKKGKKSAIEIVRKHRLWETFLFEKLGFTWDEVHDIAEQLEHIKSPELIERLNKFLNYPKNDPHGDVIPQADTEFKVPEKITLNEISVGETCKIIGVNDHSSDFLVYADSLGIAINKQVKLTASNTFDDLIEIEIKGKRAILSKTLAGKFFVSKLAKKSSGK